MSSKYIRAPCGAASVPSLRCLQAENSVPRTKVSGSPRIGLSDPRSLWLQATLQLIPFFQTQVRVVGSHSISSIQHSVLIKNLNFVCETIHISCAVSVISSSRSLGRSPCCLVMGNFRSKPASSNRRCDSSPCISLNLKASVEILCLFSKKIAESLGSAFKLFS